MGNGKMKRKIENGKLDFTFFCFRFTIYSEEQIIFIDILVLFQKTLRGKFKERNKLIIRKK